MVFHFPRPKSFTVNGLLKADFFDIRIFFHSVDCRVPIFDLQEGVGWNNLRKQKELGFLFYFVEVRNTVWYKSVANFRAFAVR